MQAPSPGRALQARACGGRSLACLLAVALAVACKATAPELPSRIVLPAPEERVAAWREDLAFLARELPRRHVRPFGVTSQRDFSVAVDALDKRFGELDDATIVIELARLCASIGDGHTGFHLHGPRLGFRTLPLWLISLSDGIFVKGTRAPLTEALGSRVLRIGDLPIEEARARLRPFVPRDNDMDLLVVEGAYLTRGEVLVAIGAADSPLRASYTVIDAAGRERTLECEARGEEQPAMYVAYRDGQGAPLAERLRVGPYVHALLEDRRVLYLQYNQCRDASAFRAFCATAFAEADRLRPELVVVDLRANAGGRSEVNRAMYASLDERPWLRGRLVALIGRGTYSSGMWAAVDLQERYGARLVGEPTGGKPHAPGDQRILVLPRSKLDVGYSTQVWRKGGQRYAGAWVEPDVRVEESSDEHFSGRDPALEAALKLAPLAALFSPGAARPQPRSARAGSSEGSWSAWPARDGLR